MWLVDRKEVGTVAYGRLQRDGAIRTLIPGLALPADVPDSPALRRHVLRRCIPHGCQVSALGALWVHGLAPSPTSLDIRVPKGRHVRNWRETMPLTYHAVGVQSGESLSAGFVALATAIADALAWSPLELAVPAATRALIERDQPARHELADAVAAQVRTSERAATAWTTVHGALSAAPSPRIGPPSFADQGAA